MSGFFVVSHILTFHLLWKGSGTHVASATTCPPLFTSIAARGEWSMGKVLDVYFQFAASGDFYLGQLLTLKNPNSVVVVEALKLMFGRILMEHGSTSMMYDP